MRGPKRLRKLAILFGNALPSWAVLAEALFRVVVLPLVFGVGVIVRVVAQP